MEDKELQWSSEFLNRIRAGFTDEEWESAWIELWDSRGSSGRIALAPSIEWQEPDGTTCRASVGGGTGENQ